MVKLTTTPHQQNIVKKLLAFPCAPDPLIWIEAVAQAAVTAFVQFQKPDLKELYHQITGESWIETERNIISGFAKGGSKFGRGSAMNTSGPVGKPADGPSKALRYILIIPGILDNVNFWAYIAALGQDTVINAANIAFEVAGCGQYSHGYYSYSNSPYGAVNQCPGFSGACDWVGVVNGVPDTPFAAELNLGAYQDGGLAYSLGVQCAGVDVPVTLKTVSSDGSALYDMDVGQINEDGVSYSRPKVFGQFANPSAFPVSYQVQACHSGPCHVAGNPSGFACVFGNPNNGTPPGAH
jgi:hypothetical protein